MSHLDEFFRESLIPWDYGILEAKDYVKDALAGKVRGWVTGISSLDDYIRLLKRELTVVAGRAGTGKTAIGMQLAESVATQMMARNSTGIIAIFSAEMDSMTLALRTACGLENVSLWKLQIGKITPDEGRRVDARLDTLLGGPFKVDQSSAPTLEHMVDQLKVYKDESTPIELVMFDYLELAGEIDKVENLRVAKISRGLKAIAKTFDTPVIALAQMNRDIERRAKKSPMLSDLMQGGEREPDRIIMMVRDEDDDTETYAHVVKNRNGPRGVAPMIFDETNMRFKAAAIETVDLDY